MKRKWEIAFWTAIPGAMRLEHSIEARRDYNSSRRHVYPPPDLQITSFRALVSKAAHRTRQTFHGLRPQRKSGSQRSDARQVPTAPAPRRPLTPRLPADRTAQETADQSQSPFFRLPLELRQEIYKQVLGSSNIHVTHAVALRHLRCKCASCPGYASYYDYGGAWKRTWACDSSKYDYDGDRLSIALLLSCRWMYAEAIGLLYSSNTFTFQNSEVLRRFLHLLTPVRRACLTAVHMDVCADLVGGDSLRNGTCEDLAELPGLRSLELRVHPPPSPQYLAGFNDLSELKGMPNTRRVRVYLPDQSEAPAWMHEGPFEALPLDAWPWLGRCDLPDGAFVF